MQSIIPILSVLAFFFGPPLVLTAILVCDKQLASRLTPWMNYKVSELGGDLFETVAKPRDIVNNKFIIPNYSNVFLQYQASGEFSKYLQRVEILEFPLKCRAYSKFKKKKFDVNEYTWSAVFHFEQQPKEGKMNVIYC